MIPTSPTAAKSTLEIRLSGTPLSSTERQERLKDPGFGRYFTDHMVVVPYSEGEGWGRGALQAYAPISFAPSASVLHYGQAIFEGFKAYRQPDGSIKTFRPDANAKRFNLSAARLAMPALPVERFLDAADTLIGVDREWVPSVDGQSLYMRPLMVSTDPFLGVRPAHNYLFILIASPAGQYFAKGVKPVTVWISEEFVRASPGGTGSAKFAGNYAASLLAQKRAAAEGCDQVVWLDAIHRRDVEEMGGMNIFFVFRDGERVTLVTPELTGTLLPGITRDSILRLGADLGFETSERRVSVEEWKRAAASGHMAEAFACGTAAVITPIGRIKSAQGDFVMNGGATGPIATQLRQKLVNIQHGREADPHGWMHTVVPG